MPSRRTAALLVAAATLIAPLAAVAPASAAAPANNNFSGAEVLAPGGGSIVRSNAGANGQGITEPSPIIGDAQASIWFKWTAPTSGRQIIDTIGTDTDTTLAVFDVPTGLTVSLSNLEEIVSVDDGGCDLSSVVQFDAVAGTTYYIQVDVWDPSLRSTNIPLTWGNHRGAPPANDDVTSAQTLSVATPVTVTATNAEATSQVDVGEDQSMASVWYKVNVPGPRRLDVQIDPDPTDNAFGFFPFASAVVLFGSQVDNLDIIDYVDPAAGPIGVDIPAAGTAWIRVESMVCDQGGFTLGVSDGGRLVTTGYSDAELQALWDAAGKIGMSPEDLQHDSVGIVEYIYGIAGVTPGAQPAPPSGPNLVGSAWQTTDAPVLSSLSSRWSLNESDTQKYATGIVSFLLSLT